LTVRRPAQAGKPRPCKFTGEKNSEKSSTGQSNPLQAWEKQVIPGWGEREIRLDRGLGKKVKEKNLREGMRAPIFEKSTDQDQSPTAY